MWEHEYFTIIINSGFDLMNKVSSRMKEEYESQGYEIIQVLVIPNAGEAIVFMKRKKVS